MSRWRLSSSRRICFSLCSCINLIGRSTFDRSLCLAFAAISADLLEIVGYIRLSKPSREYFEVAIEGGARRRDSGSFGEAEDELLFRDGHGFVVSLELGHEVRVAQTLPFCLHLDQQRRQQSQQIGRDF